MRRIYGGLVDMDTLSLVSAVVSVTGAVLTATLGGTFEWRRQRSEREMARRDRMRRYRQPLLQSAATLQARLGNALRVLKGERVTEVARGEPRQAEYNTYETLYRIAAYLGYVHILFQEVYLLDLGSRRRNRRLVKLVVAVGGAVAGHDDFGRTGVLLGGEQRLIGELMVAPETSEEGRRRCRGYADFRARLDDDPGFARAFQPLLDYIGHIGEDAEAKIRRLTLVHNALIDLIDFLDPHRVWVEGPRERLELPPDPAPAAAPAPDAPDDAGSPGEAEAEGGAGPGDSGGAGPPDGAGSSGGARPPVAVRRVVPDIRSDAMADSRDFYRLLGLEEVMNLGWVMTLASPDNPTAQLILMTEEQTAPVTPDISIEVDDVDAVYAAVRAGGAEIVRPLRDEEWGVRRFFVADPNGRVVNVLTHR